MKNFDFSGENLWNFFKAEIFNLRLQGRVKIFYILFYKIVGFVTRMIPSTSTLHTQMYIGYNSFILLNVTRSMHAIPISCAIFYGMRLNLSKHFRQNEANSVKCPIASNSEFQTSKSQNTICFHWMAAKR